MIPILVSLHYIHSIASAYYINEQPGVDDVLALLLALAAKPEEIEILLLSVTYGNVEVQG